MADTISKIYLEWDTIHDLVDVLAEKIITNYPNIDSITGLARGGLIPSVLLSHKLDIPWTLAVHKNTLVVDDINDTGATFNWIKQDWMNACMPNETDAWNSVWSGNVRFATLTDNLASNFDQCVNYCCDTINKDEDDVWLVYPWENVGEY